MKGSIYCGYLWKRMHWGKITKKYFLKNDQFAFWPQQLIIYWKKSEMFFISAWRRVRKIFLPFLRLSWIGKSFKSPWRFKDDGQFSMANFVNQIKDTVRRDNLNNFCTLFGVIYSKTNTSKLQGNPINIDCSWKKAQVDEGFLIKKKVICLRGRFCWKQRLLN